MIVTTTAEQIPVMYQHEYEPIDPSEESSRPVKVFLIEDHQVVRYGPRRLFDLDGQATIIGEASTGEDAINDPALGLADVVTCDVMLPGIDGIETTRGVMDKYPHIRIVMLSSFGDTHLGPALETDAAGYLLKRASQEELVRAVKDAARGGSPLSPALNALLVDRYHQIQIQIQTSDSQNLTERQSKVLRMVATGETNRAIAENLFLSPATVKRELRHVFDVMGVSNRAHAVSEAQRRGLI